MSGMDEVFGRMDRPESPDFWRLSDLILKLDGRVEAAPPAERSQVFKDTVNEHVDLESLSYMATQRAMRIVPPKPTRENADLFQKIAAAFMDGFVLGCEFRGEVKDEQ